MKCSRLRIALLTFILGVVSVSFFNSEYNIWTEIQVDVPKVESETPFICNIVPTKRFSMYRHRDLDFGGSSGGQSCNEFIKSLGKLTNQSRRILAYTPCGNSILK